MVLVFQLNHSLPESFLAVTISASLPCLSNTHAHHNLLPTPASKLTWAHCDYFYISTYLGTGLSLMMEQELLQNRDPTVAASRMPCMISGK